MKRSVLLSTMLLLATISFSQLTLQYKNNGLLAGDSISTKEIQYVLPGNAGPDQIWDFSKIEYKDNNFISKVNASASQELKGVSEYNTLLIEDGSEYFYKITQNTFEEKGFVNKEVSLVYSDPIIKLKYPFAYGDNYTDKFAGEAMYQKTAKIDFTGDYTVTADAYGTLALPDKYINNTLRVKVEKNGYEIHPCGSAETHTVCYYWYAPGYRYPVFSIREREYSKNNAEPVITKTAFINVQQGHWTDSTPAVSNLTTNTGNEDFTVVPYPNPFDEQVSYNYFLKKQMQVTAELYDISGKYIAGIVDNETQQEGRHTGNIDAVTYNLTPGIYYIRFTFDNKIVVSKVVKI